MRSTALLTDHYELTMLQAALHSGAAHRHAIFEVFARRLPPGRRYGVVCGVSRVAEAVERLHFGPDELDFLASSAIVDPTTLRYLEEFRFSGSIHAYPDGELYFPNSPIARIEGTFAETLLLETIVLSILNFDSAVASAAARMVQVAKGRTLIEMGSRRTHEQAAIAAARAAYVVGFAATSNLEAGRIYSIPTTGTAGHALMLAHESEIAAFEAQVAAQGADTTALVDTFEIGRGIERAVSVFGPKLRAIRIDSGNLAEGAAFARARLDALGAEKTGIILSGDLDEYAIDELSDAPVDGFGVGTRLVGGSGHPTANFVFKLVAIGESPAQLQSVAKTSENKATIGGRKAAVRRKSDDGTATAEYTYDPETTEPPIGGQHRLLQRPIMQQGRVLYRDTLADIRLHHQATMEELSPHDRINLAGRPALQVQPWSESR
jgi:nicotinate phosphoribosyltransferase